jgi:hypothetical protein
VDLRDFPDADPLIGLDKTLAGNFKHDALKPKLVSASYLTTALAAVLGGQSETCRP